MLHCTNFVFLQLPRPQRFPSSYLSRVEALVETVSEHIFWKNKELAEESRSANLAVAAFVKVGDYKLSITVLLSWLQFALNRDQYKLYKLSADENFSLLIPTCVSLTV